MLKRLTILSFCVTAAAGSTGCSGETPSSTAAAAMPANVGAAAPLDACTVITADEIARIIGETVLPPESAGFECSFRRRSEGGLSTRAVRIRLEEGAGTPYALFDSYRTNIQAALGAPYEPESVLGLGTIAAWDGDALLAATSVGPGKSAFLIVQLDGVPAEQERPYSEGLAAAALSRLTKERP